MPLRLIFDISRSPIGRFWCHTGMLESENWSCKLLIILTVNVQVWPYQFFFLMVNKTYEKDRSKYL